MNDFIEKKFKNILFSKCKTYLNHSNRKFSPEVSLKRLEEAFDTFPKSEHQSFEFVSNLNDLLEEFCNYKC